MQPRTHPRFTACVPVPCDTFCADPNRRAARPALSAPPVAHRVILPVPPVPEFAESSRQSHPGPIDIRRPVCLRWHGAGRGAPTMAWCGAGRPIETPKPPQLRGSVQYVQYVLSYWTPARVLPDSGSTSGSQQDRTLNVHAIVSNQILYQQITRAEYNSNSLFGDHHGSNHQHIVQ